MRPETKSRWLAVLLFEAVVLVSCTSPPRDGNAMTQGVPASTSHNIAELDAVRLAEEFVVDNGYTDLPATRTGSDLFRESVDDSDPAARLRSRANTLKRKACGVMAGNAWSKADGWTVVFCFNPDRDGTDPELKKLTADRGRAVVMGPDGKDLRILHVDIALDAAGLKRLE
jgi:hypothetical protein